MFQTERRVQMNKYEDGLKTLLHEINFPSKECDVHLGEAMRQIAKAEKDLQELVDKSTPKNVDLSCDTLACPYCETGRIYDWENEKRFKYCADCGQALDWRKND